jgi:hypothetical protein
LEKLREIKESVGIYISNSSVGIYISQLAREGILGFLEKPQGRFGFLWTFFLYDS